MERRASASDKRDRRLSANFDKGADYWVNIKDVTIGPQIGSGEFSQVFGMIPPSLHFSI